MAVLLPRLRADLGIMPSPLPACADARAASAANSFSRAPRSSAKRSSSRNPASCSDVTRRRAAELHLERQRSILEQAETIAHVGSWEWDVGT